MKFSESLKKPEDFKNVYRKGRSNADENMVLYFRNNGLQINRIGIVATKKTGNSVVRHRLTRLVREAYRSKEGLFSKGIDLIIILNKASVGKKTGDMEESLVSLAKRHNILK